VRFGHRGGEILSSNLLGDLLITGSEERLRSGLVTWLIEGPEKLAAGDVDRFVPYSDK
jgi:hypothetical protein